MSLSSSNDSHNGSKATPVSAPSDSQSKSMNDDALSMLLTASVQLLSPNSLTEDNPKTPLVSNETSIKNDNQPNDNQEELLPSNDTSQQSRVKSTSPDGMLLDHTYI
jgi:hypothetical protein